MCRPFSILLPCLLIFSFITKFVLHISSSPFGGVCLGLWHHLSFILYVSRRRRSFPRICTNLGHGKSGGSGEEPSAPILILIPERIKTVCLNQPICTASQVTSWRMLWVLRIRGSCLKNDELNLWIYFKLLLYYKLFQMS